MPVDLPSLFYTLPRNPAVAVRSYSSHPPTVEGGDSVSGSRKDRTEVEAARTSDTDALFAFPSKQVGIPLAFGTLSGFITRTSVKTWYPTLVKPAGEPPKWAFPVRFFFFFPLVVSWSSSPVAGS
jgi:hypothetical protein